MENIFENSGYLQQTPREWHRLTTLEFSRYRSIKSKPTYIATVGLIEKLLTGSEKYKIFRDSFDRFEYSKFIKKFMWKGPRSFTQYLDSLYDNINATHSPIFLKNLKDFLESLDDFDIQQLSSEFKIEIWIFTNDKLDIINSSGIRNPLVIPIFYINQESGILYRPDPEVGIFSDIPSPVYCVKEDSEIIPNSSEDITHADI